MNDNGTKMFKSFARFQRMYDDFPLPYGAISIFATGYHMALEDNGLIQRPPFDIEKERARMAELRTQIDQLKKETR